jgi:hypothetical protein
MWAAGEQIYIISKERTEKANRLGRTNNILITISKANKTIRIFSLLTLLAMKSLLFAKICFILLDFF